MRYRFLGGPVAALGATLCATLVLAFAAPVSAQTEAEQPPIVGGEVPVAPASEARPHEIVFCIDTSGSMTPAMVRAKKTIVTIVQEIQKANPDQPLRIGFVRYGDGTRNYRVFPLTDDLEAATQTLYSTPSNVGSMEFVGTFIRVATEKIKWSSDKNVERRIYVVGNETADQGPEDFRVSASRAAQKGIIVNAVYCPPSALGEDMALMQLQQPTYVSGPPNSGVSLTAARRMQTMPAVNVAVTRQTWLYTAYFGGGECYLLLDGNPLFERLTHEQVKTLVEVILPQQQMLLQQRDLQLQGLERQLQLLQRSQMAGQSGNSTGRSRFGRP